MSIQREELGKNPERACIDVWCVRTLPNGKLKLVKPDFHSAAFFGNLANNRKTATAASFSHVASFDKIPLYVRPVNMLKYLP